VTCLALRELVLQSFVSISVLYHSRCPLQGNAEAKAFYHRFTWQNGGYGGRLGGAAHSIQFVVHITALTVGRVPVLRGAAPDSS